MRSEVNYITIPVSRLKPQVSLLFTALEERRRVFVTRHGAVVAAIDPYDMVPAEVLASFSAPISLSLSEVSARDIGKSSPTRAVADAERGLPSLITKDRNVYGLLRHADSLPDLGREAFDRNAALDSATQEFLDSHPEASREELLDFVDSWSVDPDVHSTSRTYFRFSEDLQEPHLDEASGGLLDPQTTAKQLVMGVRDALVEHRPFQAKPLEALADPLRDLTREASSDWELLWEGVAAEQRGDVYEARVRYVACLVIDDTPNAAAFWLLGELARKEEHYKEAADLFEAARATVALMPPESSIRDVVRLEESAYVAL